MVTKIDGKAQTTIEESYCDRMKKKKDGTYYAMDINAMCETAKTRSRRKAILNALGLPTCTFGDYKAELEMKGVKDDIIDRKVFEVEAEDNE